MINEITLNNFYLQGYVGCFALNDKEFQETNIKSLKVNILNKIKDICYQHCVPLIVNGGFITVDLIRLPEQSVWIPRIFFYAQAMVDGNILRKVFYPLFAFLKHYKLKACYSIQNTHRLVDSNQLIDQYMEDSMLYSSYKCFRNRVYHKQVCKTKRGIAYHKYSTKPLSLNKKWDMELDFLLNEKEALTMFFDDEYDRDCAFTMWWCLFVFVDYPSLNFKIYLQDQELFLSQKNKQHLCLMHKEVAFVASSDSFQGL